MSANLIPSDPGPGSLQPHSSPAPARGWGEPGPESSFRIQDFLSRAWSAVRRYWWLIAGVAAIGTSVGYWLTRTVPPKFDVYGTIWVAKGGSGGAVRSPGLISEALAWSDLARSWIVLDEVVSRLALYVTPTEAGDAPTLSQLRPSEALRPGRYALTIDPEGANYSLLRVTEARGTADSLVETGAVGDSIGRSVGFRWHPPAESLPRGRRIEFVVVTPREAAVRLSGDLRVSPPQQSNLMRLSLSGDDPRLLSATLNMILEVFIEEAARLKRENLSDVRRTVEEQLDSARVQLARARSSLETFKVNTITLPTENTPIAPGVAMATNPVFNAFFQDNVSYKVIQRDREALERILQARAASGGRIPVEALRGLQAVVQSNPGLQTELTNLAAAQEQLRRLSITYTDSYPPVRDLRQRISLLETTTLPELAEASLIQLRAREDDMRGRIEGQARELREIPQRTIEESSRALEVSIADRIYTDLQTRYNEAKLAELSAMPDVEILDPAVAPLRPSGDTASGILFVAIAGSLGAALLLALLLDRIDKRFRYPEQATNELGLDIVGAIPTLTNPRNSSARLQEASQLVESFRSLSLTVRSAFDGMGPIQLTISSPGPGDGKSFISANLASALADGGFRTVLIDGDIRRGALHKVFGVSQTPGLVDHLANETALHEILLPTSHGNLFLVPCGTRRRHGPELLAGNTMSTLIRDLREQFDAVIVDSAPLGAGIDPYALGVATGAMLIVLRTGETDRKLAQAKLEVLDRMPVRILGTVLNDIGENPQFKYYYYLEGYGALETAEDRSALIGSGNGASGRR
ncbi:MAG TPA: polysaccharide biosynthesis tyrosine autokinase [Gemmatimonadaceae bacterium]|nr:polysaccharide biosynthesis tyrosine autokinase [Gemmatimonadaceae bacterium]